MPLTAPEFNTYVRRGMHPNERRLAELRALGSVTGSAGGYTVPTELQPKIIERLDSNSAVRRVAEVIPTAAGGPMPIPTVDDTDVIGERIAENSTPYTNETDIAFGQKIAGAWLYSSKPIKMSFALVQDGLDIEERITRILGRRIGRAQNIDFTTGNGSAGPEGIVTGATVGITAASTTAFTYDELEGLVYSIDGAYRENPDECGWMMSDTTFALANKLKDSNGEPIWDRSTRRLFEYGVTINNAMPAATAGLKPILFGNLSAGYLIRDVLESSVRRLSERFADSLQVGFIGHHRSDGFVQDAYAYAALAMHA